MGEGTPAVGCLSGLIPSVRGLHPLHTNIKPRTLPLAMPPLASAPRGEPLRGGWVVMSFSPSWPMWATVLTIFSNWQGFFSPLPAHSEHPKKEWGGSRPGCPVW